MQLCEGKNPFIKNIPGDGDTPSNYIKAFKTFMHSAISEKDTSFRAKLKLMFIDANLANTHNQTLLRMSNLEHARYYLDQEYD